MTRVRRPSIVTMLLHVAAVLLTCFGQVATPARMAARDAEASVVAPHASHQPTMRRATRVERSASVRSEARSLHGTAAVPLTHGLVIATPSVRLAVPDTTSSAALSRTNPSPTARGPPAAG
jgi:hypothetical protein